MFAFTKPQLQSRYNQGVHCISSKTQKQDSNVVFHLRFSKIAETNLVFYISRGLFVATRLKCCPVNPLFTGCKHVREGFQLLCHQELGLEDYSFNCKSLLQNITCILQGVHKLSFTFNFHKLVLHKLTKTKKICILFKITNSQVL